ncbi:D-alanyl-lipoteichoic acid acyltransferase DltB, MBOAT superfamily [Pseudobutyrivibrio sp. YE44]|uniref:MBOAT family O-acyltransferase n=1 Tax=Pseudobutyrivibrio sp. YE44 TaxID=1520802 RepID=UPI0008838FD9|nr:MBOAT family O-acyltransferase [Pseudobutyrivibrio sp. YE44]SDB54325.1 D-alanyl-lipoteichoic acid acyltransferase DltB, MBOAT superfamily [Pseudobutyrivibrio sp. YE44]
MLFNSINYATFLPIVFILYWALPTKFRTVLLLAASYYFYMSWNAKYLVLILFVTVVSYASAIGMDCVQNKSTKKIILFTSSLASLGVLFVFKYYNFFAWSVMRFLPLQTKILDLVLPVGISFYTFQTLSYVIDVYRGDMKSERNFITYATFVTFFPQLVAGPIERSSRLLPQLKEKHMFNLENARLGMMLILWGLFKKIVIADNVALFVDKVYGNISEYDGASIFVATVFFSIQIYCDFSGYSDMARGSAKLFGIELMENFRSPYLSTSIREFWSRWHISLSTWFRDYLYIPLGGNRVSKLRNAINLLITFMVSGLWHGANWTFILWGGIHGLGQVAEKYTFGKIKSDSIVLKIVRGVLVYIFVTFAWIFFRASGIGEALFAVRSIAGACAHPVGFAGSVQNVLVADVTKWIPICGSIIVLLVVDLIYRNKSFDEVIKLNGFVRRGVALLVIIATMIFAYVGQSSFVYFQF